MSLHHPEFLLATYRTAVRLIATSGAATDERVRYHLPFSGYSIDEVRDVLGILEQRGDLLRVGDESLAPRVYLPGREWPVPEEKEQ